MDPGRRALLLSVFTVAYNVGEAAVALVAGVIAGSPALIGFGSDSLVESISGGVMTWRFGRHGDVEGADRDRIERTASRGVGLAFFALAGYVTFDAGTRLATARPPEPSLVGIALAVASLVVMPVLFVLKDRTAEELSSPSLRADARQTLACLILSVALLVGLGANWAFGFWQADPVAGIFIAAYLVKEGIEAVQAE